jgi:FPC/CPF motif-containing protein YcgG
MQNSIDMKAEKIIQEYKEYLSNKEFPCVAAKAALSRGQIKCMVADHMGCPANDRDILQFLYDFVDIYRSSSESFYSAAVLFKAPHVDSEEMFDKLLWQRLQALADMDAANYSYDKRVNNDPSSAHFSFSLKEEAFFIIGLHPAATRVTRQFSYPALVFNPHAEFEKLREKNQYERMKDIVRKRDIAYSGSANPMLQDFGEISEVYQYSGRNYDAGWECPLKIRHAEIKNNSST